MRKAFSILALGLFTAITLTAQGWNSDQRLTTNSADSRTGNIAVNGDIVHVVWYDTRDGNNEIYYNRSNDGGITWGSDTRLTINTSSSMCPWVCVSGNNVHVVWADNRDGNYEVYYRRSMDGGETWGSDIRLTTGASLGSGYLDQAPTSTVSGNTVHVIWGDSRHGNFEIYYKRSTDNGTNWGTDTRLTNNSTGSFSPYVAAWGNAVYIVWWDNQNSSNYETFYKRSSDNGATWSSDTRLSLNDGYRSDCPSIVVSDNNVHVAFHDARFGYGGQEEVYYRRSTDGGLNWEPEVRISNASGGSEYPQMAVSGGNVHMAWRDTRYGNYENYYRRSADGGLTWESEKRLTNNPSTSFGLTVAASPKKAHVLWYDDRDGNWEVYYKLCDGQAPGEVVWKYQTGDAIFSSPAIGRDSTIYCGSRDTYLYALNPDGTLKWRYKTGGPVGSSPTVASNGNVYVGSSDYYLYALSPSGSLLWRYQTGNVIASSPSIDSKGIIYVGSRDGYLYAVNPSGILEWRYRTGGSVESSPSIGHDGIVYVASNDGYLYALYPSGVLKWRYKTGIDEEYSSPAIGSDGTIYFTSYDIGCLYALTPSGTLKWKYQTNGRTWSSPAIDKDEILYFGSEDGYIYAVDSSGSLKWKYQTDNLVGSSPAIGSDGIIYVGSWDNYLYALNSNGSLKWRYKTGSLIGSSPAIGEDGSVYISSYDRYIHAVASTSSGTAHSIWPKFHHDNCNSGLAPGDVGIVSIEVPSDTVWAEHSYSPAVTVQNNSEFWFASFDVECELDSAGIIVYCDTVSVIGLAPGTAQIVIFNSWTTPEGNKVPYSMKVTSLIPRDVNPDNDHMSKSFLSLWPPRDVAVKNILTPPSIISPGSMHTPCATITNFAEEPASFNVVCEINSAGMTIYVDTIQVLSLETGEDEKITFNAWTAGSISGQEYTLTVTTLLPGDLDHSDDFLSKVITIGMPARDVAVVNVISPPSQVPPGGTYIPRAAVANFFSGPLTFDVVCDFYTSGTHVYSDTVAVDGLTGGSNQEVAFAAWTAGVTEGLEYTVTVTSLLDEDVDHSNDFYSKTITTKEGAGGFDIAVRKILAPPEIIFTASVHTPRALVANLSDEVMSFDVICRFKLSLSTIYEDTVEVVDLAPGEDREVSFENWIAGPTEGLEYEMTVSSYNDGDNNHSNDAITKTVTTAAALADLDIQDYSGNLSANTMELTGVANTIVVGAYIMVNPDDWEKNVDLYDGPSNVDLTLSYSNTDLVTYDGKHKIDAEKVSPDVKGVSLLGLSNAEQNLVQVFIPNKVKKDEIYVGRVMTTGTGSEAFNTDEFILKVNVIDGNDHGGPHCSGFGGNPLAEGNRLYWSEFGFGEHGYNIYRAEPGSEEFTKLNQEIMNFTSYIDYDVSRETEYTYKLGLVMPDQSEILLGPLVITSSQEVGSLVLDQNFPNPFSDVTEISYFLPKGTSQVNLRVYDITGKLVKTLTEGESTDGMNTVIWDGRDSRGIKVPCGVYFYMLNTEQASQSRKMVVIR